MMILANIAQDPAAIAAWICAGLASGWFIGKVTEEPSYGAIGDLVVGAIGGLAGGLMFAMFKNEAEFWGALAVSLAGAWVFLLSGRTILAMKSE